jgi:hypothetical protein
MQANDNRRRPQTVGELEAAGMKLGISIAQRVIRGYGDSPLKPDNPLAVLAYGQGQVEHCVQGAKTNCGLNEHGEAAWRKGYNRGLAVQFKNPSATIKIELVKP